MVELEQPRFIRQVSTKIITSLAEAERLKEAGNVCFKDGSYREAAELYMQALSVAPATSVNRAIYYGNTAACHMRLKEFEAAVEICTHALKINSQYVKVLMRRCAAYEQLRNNQKALDDAKKVLEIDPQHEVAKEVVKRIEEKVDVQNAVAREEMIGKLKDLGSTMLGAFGVSLDDFKAEKDPETGSYNVSFKK